MKKYVKYFCFVMVSILLFSTMSCQNTSTGKNNRGSTGKASTDDIVSKEAGMAESRYVNVKSFGASGKGVEDDSGAIQKAVDSIRRSGGTVYLPAGVYRLGKGIHVPVGVHIEGTTFASTGPWQQFLDAEDKNSAAMEHARLKAPAENWLQFDMYKGTWILVDHGAGNVNSPPSFQLEGSSSIKKIGFVHKGLPPVSDKVVEYPPAIGVYSDKSLPYTRDGVTVEDISLANPYIGIAFTIGKDLKDYYLDKNENDITASFGRHRVHNVMGGALYRGLMFKGLLDTVDVSNIQFNYTNYDSGYVAARAQNCTDIEIARADGMSLSNILSFGADYGLRTVPALGRSVSLRAVNLNLEARIPMSLKSSGQYEISNSYFLTHNFANLSTEKRFVCVEVETDNKCIHQSFFMFSNLFFQNAMPPEDTENIVLDVTLDAGNNAIITNSMFWGWDKSAQGDPVIQFTRRNMGPASLSINNSVFTSNGLPGTLLKIAGKGYKDGDVQFNDCRIPDSLDAKNAADEGKVWFNNCTLFNIFGSNQRLDSK